MDNLIAPFEKCLTPMARATLRAKIAALEAHLEKQAQLKVEPIHHFSKDVYAREMFIPKDALVVGAIHRFQNFNIISKGDVSFFSIDGMLRVKAPHSFVASPGVKRVIYAHEDTVWTTIHGTPELDLKKIEEIFIAKSYADLCGVSDEELQLIEEARKWLGEL